MPLRLPSKLMLLNLPCPFSFSGGSSPAAPLPGSSASAVEETLILRPNRPVVADPLVLDGPTLALRPKAPSPPPLLWLVLWLLLLGVV